MNDAPMTPSIDGCLRCGAPWKLLFGEWAELGEGMLGLEVLACASCGKVELRLPRHT